MGEKEEEEDGEMAETECGVCSYDRSQFLASAPGRFSIYLFPLPPSVHLSPSPLLLQG